jgi:CRP-like cAMP-binding protein
MTRIVSLVDVDPDLVEGIPEEELDLACRVLARPLYELPKGRWAPELLRVTGDGGFGLLVVDGAIMREVGVCDRTGARMLGPGDVLQPAASGGLLDCPVTWTALVPSTVVVLDARFTLAARRWPTLGVNLQRRLLDQTDRIALHTALLALPRVERRLLALLWQLAERWGRVTPAGVEVSLKLTHEQLGRLVGAQRPSVTLGLGELAHGDLVTRTAGGGWLLRPDSRELLACRDAASGAASARSSSADAS